jgi:NAD(P)-dependent dehydrogenase (short-subunit alcohol dehydrogenase family)
MLSFTHSLALDSKQGLRAVNVEPGGVSTALAFSTLDNMPEGCHVGLWAKQTPLPHGKKNDILGDPSAVASVIAWWLPTAARTPDIPKLGYLSAGPNACSLPLTG